MARLPGCPTGAESQQTTPTYLWGLLIPGRAAGHAWPPGLLTSAPLATALLWAAHGSSPLSTARAPFPRHHHPKPLPQTSGPVFMLSPVCRPPCAHTSAGAASRLAPPVKLSPRDSCPGPHPRCPQTCHSVAPGLLQGTCRHGSDNACVEASHRDTATPMSQALIWYQHTGHGHR